MSEKFKISHIDTSMTHLVSCACLYYTIIILFTMEDGGPHACGCKANMRTVRW